MGSLVCVTRRSTDDHDSALLAPSAVFVFMPALLVETDTSFLPAMATLFVRDTEERRSVWVTSLLTEIDRHTHTHRQSGVTLEFGERKERSTPYEGCVVYKVPCLHLLEANMNHM